MQTPVQFVDVLVPLALPKLLTYALEADDAGVVPGMRVVVQVGARKRYTAVVWRKHTEAPAAYAARPIESVIDVRPMVTQEQLALWEWMADYYMCSRGEVMSAALPSGLKLSSQSRLVLHPDARLNKKP